MARLEPKTYAVPCPVDSCPRMFGVTIQPKAEHAGRTLTVSSSIVGHPLRAMRWHVATRHTLRYLQGALMKRLHDGASS